MADGQITAGSKVVKPNARKLRRLATEPVPSLGGFAGVHCYVSYMCMRVTQHHDIYGAWRHAIKHKAENSGAQSPCRSWLLVGKMLPYHVTCHVPCR
jgi:hypothetical protein